VQSPNFSVNAPKFLPTVIDCNSWQGATIKITFPPALINDESPEIQTLAIEVILLTAFHIIFSPSLQHPSKPVPCAKPLTMFSASRWHMQRVCLPLIIITNVRFIIACIVQVKWETAVLFLNLEPMTEVFYLIPISGNLAHQETASARNDSIVKVHYGSEMAGGSCVPNSRDYEIDNSRGSNSVVSM
jgi:hypothetical protein